MFIGKLFTKGSSFDELGRLDFHIIVEDFLNPLGSSFIHFPLHDKSSNIRMNGWNQNFSLGYIML